MSNPDMAQFLGVFLDEAREQLELIESSILQMERGDRSSEILQALFRAAHTVKGSSRAMGFMAVGDLTHHMENVLDDLRNGRQSVTTASVDVLLNCLDTLTALIDDVATNGTATAALDADVARLIARLDALCSNDKVEVLSSLDAVATEPLKAGISRSQITLSEYEQTSLEDAIASGLTIFHVGITIAKDCLMKSVRAYMILDALGALGSVLVSAPNEDQLDAEAFDRYFELLFAGSCSATEVESALGRIAELDLVYARPWVRTDNDGSTEVVELEPPGTLPPALLSPGPAVGVDKRAVETDVAPEPRVSPSTVAPNQTIRVDVARLDNLLNLIGEMVIERTQIAQVGKDLRERYHQDSLVEQLIEGTYRLARISSDLQDQIMKARMLPIDGVFQRMPRMVRDLAQKTGKEVEFLIEGGETELDRSVLEVLGDPLIHLLRNSVDHGIEPPQERVLAGKRSSGLVRLCARHEENHIAIEIRDDGRGIDPTFVKNAAVGHGAITRAEADLMTENDALMLIFASGISTAKNLSDISGRGVGMDIVRSNLERLGGRVDVDTKLGMGTTFTIHLPLTLAVMRGLIVRAAGATYVFPLSCVEEMLRLGAHEGGGSGGISRRSLGGQAAIVLRHRTVPLISLASALAGDARAVRPELIDPHAYVVVIGIGSKTIGVIVDGVGGEQEVVIKSLGKWIGEVNGVSGATILGDGSVALIVDVSKLASGLDTSPIALSPREEHYPLQAVL